MSSRAVYKFPIESAPSFPNNATNFKTFEVNEENENQYYRLLISAITPRPIGFISTKGKNGVCNVSPYSYFNAVSHDPPTLVFSSVTRRNRDDGQGDTLKNLIETKHCVVNIISEWMADAANHACGPYDYDLDEINISSLTTLPGVTMDVPRIKESAVQMECKLVQTVPIRNHTGKETCTLAIIQIVAFHVNENVYEEKEGVINPRKLKPVARLGGDAFYSFLGKIIDLPRPNKDGTSSRKK